VNFILIEANKASAVSSPTMLIVFRFLLSNLPESIKSAGEAEGVGPMAQWTTRLTTDQKIPGSTPGWIVLFAVKQLLQTSNSLFCLDFIRHESISVDLVFS
jgi:hypothetical protein